jgi:hypothetical protein
MWDRYKLVFRSKQKLANTDYHGDVNEEVFKSSFMKLLHYAGTKLKNAVIMMDNISYRSIQAHENVKLLIFTGYRRATFAMTEVTSAMSCSPLFLCSNQ